MALLTKQPNKQGFGETQTGKIFLLISSCIDLMKLGL